MEEGVLRKIFAEVFGLNCDSVSNDMNPETVDSWDSFGHMKLITAVENGLGIQLRMDQVMAVDSYASLCRIVAETAKT